MQRRAQTENWEKTVQSYDCPTLSLQTPSAYHIEINGHDRFGERLWLNPKKDLA